MDKVMAINKNLSLGLDIGTTTISASVVDARTQKQVRAYTIANQTFVTTDEPFKKEQDAQMIFDKIETLLAEILNEYDEIGQIGITGQMHGILSPCPLDTVDNNAPVAANNTLRKAPFLIFSKR